MMFWPVAFILAFVAVPSLALTSACSGVSEALERVRWPPEEELQSLRHERKEAAGKALLPGAPDRTTDEPAWRAVRKELERSMGDVEVTGREVGEILEHRRRFLLSFDGELFVDEHHTDKAKHKPHYLFSTLLSMGPLPNFAALWDSGATGKQCDDVSLPCLVIAKSRGYAQRGILVPNPYFAHVQEWDRRSRRWGAPRNDDDTQNNSSKKPVVFWRGKVASHCDAGNKARVSALKLGLDRPDLFDVKWVTSFDWPDCPGQKKEEPETWVPEQGDFVDVANFSTYKFLLNLPGTMGGSYSRNANYIWPQGATVVFWRSAHVEFYYPALEACRTHVVMDETNAVAVTTFLGDHPSVVASLEREGAAVFRTFLCGACLERYWRLLIAKLRRSYRFDDAIDKAPNFRRALRHVADCSSLRRVRLAEGNWTQFYDDTQATPHGGHPCAYEKLPESHRLLRLCREATTSASPPRKRRRRKLLL